MIVNRQRLQSILSILGTSVGNKIMEVSNYVRFKIDTEKRKLFLSTTDFHAYLTIDFGDLSLADFSDVPDTFLIDFRQLSAIIKNSTTADVQFKDARGGNAIEVTTNGTYKFSKYSSPEAFPSVDYNYQEIGKWDVPLLQSAWNKVAVAISRDVTKINYQGVNYDGNFAATDNRRLSVVTFPHEFAGQAMLLPPVFGDVIKHCKNQVSIGPNQNGNMLIIICEEVGLIASIRLIEAKFQPYRSLIDNRSEGIKVTVPKNDLIGSLSRLMTFTDTLYKVVTVKVVHSEGAISLDLSIQNKNAGNENVESTDSDLGALDESDLNRGVILEFKYHIDNILDGVSAVDSGEDVHLDFQNDGKLWVDEENYHYLLTRITE